MKKLIGILLATLIPIVPALAAAPEVGKIEYEGNGFVEIDFFDDVSYEDSSVAVRDSSGTEYAVTVYERDDDDLTFRVDGLSPGETYEITISGIRSGRSGDYGTVTAQLTVPEAGVPSISSVDYDVEDRELEIEFSENVDFHELMLEVTDRDGNVYESRIIGSDNDSIDTIVEGLTVGETYLVKISGVVQRGTDLFQTVAAEFVARND